MNGRTCSVPGCHSRHVARGMCNAHYLKWRHQTDELPQKPCAVNGCQRPHASHGFCATHARNWRTTGNPVATGGKGVNHPRWRADHAITYQAAHLRVYRVNGAASCHTCVDCGATAREWAYDHLDRGERTQETRKGPVPYSTNPAHYMPMCKPCHTRFDYRHSALTKSVSSSIPASSKHTTEGAQA